MAVTISVKGIDKIFNKAKLYSKETMKKAENEMKITALEIETDAKKFSAVDTGRLKNSVHTVTGRDSYKYSDDKGKSYDGSLSEEGHPLNIVVGTNVTYAPFVEGGAFLFRAMELNRRGYLRRLKKIFEGK